MLKSSFLKLQTSTAVEADSDNGRTLSVEVGEETPLVWFGLNTREPRLCRLVVGVQSCSLHRLFPHNRELISLPRSWTVKVLASLTVQKRAAIVFLKDEKSVCSNYSVEHRAATPRSRQ